MRSMPLRTMLVLCALLVTLAAAPDGGEQQYETAFLAIPSAAGARASEQFINERMHYPGTPGDRRLALYMRDSMQRYGLQAHIEMFETTVYTPRVLQLQLLTDPVTTFDLHEQPIASDPDGTRPDAGIPFNAGSGSGDVRAHVVYAGRGLDADYDALQGAGVNVRGNIVLVRYGAEFRGNLAKRAQDRGAAGVIFYSDPQDDGSGRGPAYPNGPYRPAGSVQRGTISLDDSQLNIPTLPVTSVTAQRLMSDMHGAPAKITNSLVHLHVEMNATRTTLWNTVGEIPGSDPSQMVVMGAHRDAWVYGVSDDGSGIASLLEVARGLGALHQRGWTPRRSIRIIGFDAEELGELGSRAYVAAHRDELKRGCIAYFNVDEAASGPHFGAGGAAALIPAITSAAKSVDGVSVDRVRPPGGGSDFEAFIYGVGAPVMSFGYGGTLGVYHSSFDDFTYMSRFGDPGFVHQRAIAQTAGIMAMRLAEAGATAYSFASYGPVLSSGLTALEKEAQQSGVTVDTAPLQTAIAKFNVAASTYGASAADDRKALQAVQDLDALAYSSNGYASVAFPAISQALAGKDPQTIREAVEKTAESLDAISSLLR